MLPGQELGLVAPHVLVDRVPHPLLGRLVRETVSAEQLLLPRERKARDGPAHREALEQHLGAPAPQVIDGGCGASGRLGELRDRPRREGLAERQHVAVRIRVVVSRDGALLAASLLTLGHAPPARRRRRRWPVSSSCPRPAARVAAGAAPPLASRRRPSRDAGRIAPAYAGGPRPRSRRPPSPGATRANA